MFKQEQESATFPGSSRFSSKCAPGRYRKALRAEGPGHQFDTSMMIPVLPPTLVEPMVYLTARQVSASAVNKTANTNKIGAKRKAGACSGGQVPVDH